MTVTIHDLTAWKQQGRRFVMLTAYDYPTTRILGASAGARGRVGEWRLWGGRAGAFLPCVGGFPGGGGPEITGSRGTPTMGLGAGPATDAQGLVLPALLGPGDGPPPRFAKAYADI